MQYDDRTDAGRQLADRLKTMKDQNVVVVGLPRGGIPVAFEVAKALNAPLDVLVVRKLGVPFQPELAFGAIGEGGVRALNDLIVRHARLTDADMAEVERVQREELQRRAELYRRGHQRLSLKDRVLVVVDDGLATGATARAACQVARAQGAKRVVLAAPTGSAEAIEALAHDADEVVCPVAPAYFYAVGQAYRGFDQTSDEEVCKLLDRARDEIREPA